MKREEAKPLQVAAQQAADWCRIKLDARAGGFGKEYEHNESERNAFHIVHSIAVAEITRLQVIIAG